MPCTCWRRMRGISRGDEMPKLYTPKHPLSVYMKPLVCPQCAGESFGVERVNEAPGVVFSCVKCELVLFAENVTLSQEMRTMMDNKKGT